MKIPVKDIYGLVCFNELVINGTFSVNFIEIEDTKGKEILSRCSEIISVQPAPTILPKRQPETNIPIWAKLIGKHRQTQDVGVGDTLARLLSKVQADKVAHLWERYTGKMCGCVDRKQHLNLKYPY